MDYRDAHYARAARLRNEPHLADEQDKFDAELAKAFGIERRLARAERRRQKA